VAKDSLDSPMDEVYETLDTSDNAYTDHDHHLPFVEAFSLCLFVACRFFNSYSFTVKQMT